MALGRPGAVDRGSVKRRCPRGARPSLWIFTPSARPSAGRAQPPKLSNVRLASCLLSSGNWLPVARSIAAMSALASYVDKKVLVVTQDGRTIVGDLTGFDQTINVILSSSVERVYSLDEAVEEVPLGLYIVRGDNISLIGEVDPELEAEQDLTAIRAEPLGEIVH